MSAIRYMTDDEFRQLVLPMIKANYSISQIAKTLGVESRYIKIKIIELLGLIRKPMWVPISEAFGVKVKEVNYDEATDDTWQDSDSELDPF